MNFSELKNIVNHSQNIVFFGGAGLLPKVEFLTSVPQTAYTIQAIPDSIAKVLSALIEK